MKLSAKIILMALILLGPSFFVSAQSKVARIKDKIQPELKDAPDGKGIEVHLNGSHFTTFTWPDEVKKPVLFPILSSSGKTITRGYPLAPRPNERVDHPHHVGHWFNYGDVNTHDFWNNSNKIGPEHKGPFGSIKLKKVLKREVKGQNAILVVLTEWLDKDGKPMLEERTRFRFFSQGKQRAFVRTATLTAMTDILFKDNKEGMFAIRIARELEHPSTKPEIYTDANGVETSVPQLNNDGVSGIYTSANGKTGDAVWGTAAEWVLLNGKIDNQPVALTIFSHPENVGGPKPYWHARGYGLFGVNPLGPTAFDKSAQPLNYELKKGKSVKFKFLVTIDEGNAVSDAKGASAEYQKFAKEKEDE